MLKMMDSGLYVQHLPFAPKQIHSLVQLVQMGRAHSFFLVAKYWWRKTKPWISVSFPSHTFIRYCITCLQASMAVS